ncbi:MAG: hypothetical protein H3C39_01020 [Flavobacteriia bacterium]|nr:hypothetical protein [Flavobacteriia bacterium]
MIKNIINKYRLFPVLLIIVLFVCGCLSVAKVVVGFKNPKVLDITEIEKIKNLTFASDETIDLIYNKAIDSTEIIQIVSESFNGQINIFNKNGKRLCFNGKTSCSGYQLNQLNQSGDNLIKECEDEDSQNLSLILSKLTYYDKHDKVIVLSEFDDVEYIFIYYWSSFISSKKRMNEEFDIMKNSLDSSKLQYKILRINCDLRDDWNLKKGGNLKIYFNKSDKRQYELEFGNIPWNN